MSWELLLGLWGALLSTLLGLRELSKDRPIPFLSRDPDASTSIYILRLNNRSGFPLHLKSLKKFGCFEAVPRIDNSSDSLRTSLNEYNHGRIDYFISPKSTIDIRIVFDDEPKFGLLVVTWAVRNVGILPTWPVLILLKPNYLKAIKRSGGNE